MWDDLRVNGTALSSFGGLVDLSGLRATAPKRGSNLTYPGRNGDVFVAKPRSAYVVNVPMVLLGTSRADYNDRISSLAKLLDGGGSPLTLERRLTTSGGNVAHTASGDYLSGLEPAAVNLQTGRVALDLVNLDGLWHDTASTTVGAGTVTALGDVTTYRMTITLTTASSPVTVTNSVTGHSFTYSGPPGTGFTAPIIDVENMTATRVGVDETSTLSWSGTYPFALAPGVQTVTASTGSIAIVYYPAYL